jgi:PST family polysaccharide transporter
MGGFAILAVTSTDVVAIFLGPKWGPAGPLLGIFAVRGIAHVAERTLGWLHVAAGRSDRWMRWGIVSVAAQLVALFCGLRFGLTGVAVAYAAATYVLCVPALVYAGRPVQVGPAAVLKAIGPSMLAALGSVAMGIWIREAFLADVARMTRLAILCLVCGGTYTFILIGLFRVTGPLCIAGSLLRGYVPKSIADRWGFGRIFKPVRS